MRTFLKLFITVLVLAGAFVAYVVFQPSRAVQNAATRPAPQTLQRNAGGMIIGEGTNAWVRQFDAEGRLASRFRAEKWEPQKNGLVRVVRPEAELLLKGGTDDSGKEKPRPLVRIRGDDGEVVVQSLPDAAAADKPLASSQGGGAPGGKGASVGPAQPPSSGRLNGVLIEVFETEDAPEPRVTLRTNNIVFDNDTFRISTESYQDPDGTTVPPDQVKVSVTGPDFEFYGRGLTVRWNDLEERLDLLRIAHGDHLVIKNVEALSEGGGLPLRMPGRATAAAPTAWAPDALSMGGMLASADRGAALALASADKRPRGGNSPAPGAATKPARKKPKAANAKDDQPPYRAAFHDDVRVLQGEVQLATARLMNIDFLPGEKAGGPSTRPASTRRSNPTGGESGGGATQPSGPGAEAASGEALPVAAATQPAPDSAATQPTTSPSAQPVTVYWTGELTVTPSPIPAAPAKPASTAPTAPVAPAAGDEPLSPGEARAELLGAPAVLTRDALDIKTARFVFRTDGRLAMDGSPEFPRVLITQRSADGIDPDTTISTEGLTYSRGDRVAVLRGDSRVLAPIESETGSEAAGVATTPAMLDASWRETATFRLVGEDEEDLWVEHAAFAGKVDVKAPQGVVRAERLELTFDPPTEEPPATTRPATQGATQPTTRPATQPATKPAPASASPNLRRVVATDGVYCELVDATEGKRTVECQQLTLDTARSEAGDLYPRLVDASGAVHAATADQELTAGHVVLQLRPARSHAATQPASKEHAERIVESDESRTFVGRDQWALADAASIGAAGTVRPRNDPAALVELESMTATDGVRVASRDGGVASGKRLAVTVGDDGTPRVELTGDPARVEHANSAGSLTGPRIEVDPKTGLARVVGPGTLRAIQREEDKEPAAVLSDAAAGGLKSALAPAMPIEVTWASGADVRGADDRIDITGAVTLWITDTDGSVHTATAGRVSVELAKKPVEAPPATAPVAAARAKENKPAGDAQFARSMNMDLFKDMEPAKFHLYDNAVINSKLTADDGSTVRQFHLKSHVITYDPRTRHLTVPGAGQMLVEAHDAPGEPKQAGSDGAGDENALGGLASGNGVSAFQWAERLEYDRAAGTAVMDGSVVVSHQPDKKNDPPIRVDADTLTATFESEPEDAEATAKAGAADGPGAAGTIGAIGGGGQAAKLQMRSMTARGNILITREGSELAAHEITYDPASEWVVARGTPRNPATYTAPGAAGTLRAGQLSLNTRTWQVKVKDVNTRAGAVPR